jgi:anti-anti-sigma factor
VNDPAGVELIRNGTVIVARMPVEVEISQAPSLRGQLMQAVENRDLGLVIDMTATEYLDSSGVNMLFELGELLGARQLRMAIVMPQGGLVERVVVHRRSRLCHACSTTPSLGGPLKPLQPTSSGGSPATNRRAPQAAPLGSAARASRVDCSAPANVAQPATTSGPSAFASDASPASAASSRCGSAGTSRTGLRAWPPAGWRVRAPACLARGAPPCSPRRRRRRPPPPPRRPGG